jgi:hypothetical protein
MTAVVLVVSIVIGALVLFVGLWLLLTKLFSLVSGWHKLVSVFPGIDMSEGVMVSHQTARIGNILYKKCLIWECRETGFFMKTMALFKGFHSPVLIPWSEIRINPAKYVFQDGYAISVQSVPGFSMWVKKSEFSDCLKEYVLRGGRVAEPILAIL